MSSKLKKLSLLLLASGVGYATYGIIANKVFEQVFKKREVKYNVKPKHQKWFDSSNVTELNIKSYDNLNLYSYLIENHKTNNYIILVHGIWSNHESMIHYAYDFDKLGYNILLVDQRTSGKSEGEYYTYGYKESFDIVAWSNEIIKRNPKAKIALMGVSMGASTCMMTTQIGMQDNIKCIIEDCGFSNLKQQIENVLKLDYKISNTDIVLKILEPKMIKKLGLKLDDVCAKTCINSNVLPIMFIHGDKDDYVPFKMAKELYDLNKGEKIYYPVKGKVHAKSHTYKNYFFDVDEFIKKYF